MILQIVKIQGQSGLAERWGKIVEDRDILDVEEDILDVEEDILARPGFDILKVTQNFNRSLYFKNSTSLFHITKLLQSSGGTNYLHNEAINIYFSVLK